MSQHCCNPNPRVKVAVTDQKEMSSSTFVVQPHLAAASCVVWDSQPLDSCTIFFDIWDSQAGSRAKECVGWSLLVESHPCVVQPTCVHTGIPFCQRCCKWNHPTTACKSLCIVCLIRWGPHHEENHYALTSCCKGNSSANPPISPTPEGEPCTHSHTCINYWISLIPLHCYISFYC